MIEEGLSKHNLDLLDENFDPNFVKNQFGLKPTIAVMKENCDFLYRAFPDYQLIIEDMVAERDKVWLRITCTGPNKGGFMDLPNGKAFKITVFDEIRLKDGKVKAHWGVPDRFDLLVQLGWLSKEKTGSLLNKNKTRLEFASGRVFCFMNLAICIHSNSIVGTYSIVVERINR